jgi:hypothetical protein
MCGGIYLRCSTFVGRRILGLLFGVQLLLGRMILCLMLSLCIAFGRLRSKGFSPSPVGFAYGALLVVVLVALAFPCFVIGLLGSMTPVRQRLACREESNAG